MFEVLGGADVALDSRTAVRIQDLHNDLAHLLDKVVLNLLLHVAAVGGGCGGGGSSCSSSRRQLEGCQLLLLLPAALHSLHTGIGDTEKYMIFFVSLKITPIHTMHDSITPQHMRSTSVFPTHEFN